MTRFWMEFTQSVVHTPIWVWGLLAVIVYFGLMALRPSQASLTRLAILPSVFLIWGLQVLLTKTSLDTMNIGTWGAALAIGIAVGLALTASQDIRLDRQTGLLHLPGSAITLVVSLLIFACKYGFGYSLARWPELGRDATFLIASLGSSGLFTGILVGRFAGLVRVHAGRPQVPAVNTAGDLAIH
jgi:hypothetical protein